MPAQDELPFGLVLKSEKQQKLKKPSSGAADSEDVETSKGAAVPTTAALKWIKCDVGKSMKPSETRSRSFCSKLLASNDSDSEPEPASSSSRAAPVAVLSVPDAVDKLEVDGADLPPAARAEYAVLERQLPDEEPEELPHGAEETADEIPFSRRVPANPNVSTDGSPHATSAASAAASAASAEPSSRGFRRDVGIHTVGVAPSRSKGPPARCYFCNTQIAKGTARFEYQFAENRVPRWMHPECCALMPAGAKAASLAFLRPLAAESASSAEQELQRTAVQMAIGLLDGQ